MELPDPSVFRKITCTGDRLSRGHEGSDSGFFFDIGNMFHNIRLLPFLARNFPLRLIAFGDQCGSVHNKLAARFGRWLRQTEIVRSLQSTLPMGFKWAVFIAQNFSRSCICKSIVNIDESFSIFRASRRAPSGHRFVYNRSGAVKNFPVRTFTRSSGFIQLDPGTALALHIIDDIDCLCFD